MLVDEVPHNFKKNYNYSHCPLKKRPFYYTSEDEEEAPEAIKGTKIIFLLLHKSLLNYFRTKFSNVYVDFFFIFVYIYCVLFSSYTLCVIFHFKHQ